MHTVWRTRIPLRRQEVVARRSFNYVVDRVVELAYNRYNTRKVENLGAERAAAQWLIRCAASFRPKGQTAYVNTKWQLKRLPSDFVIEAIDASDSIVHHAGFDYLDSLKSLKELKLSFCYWVDSTALSKVAVHCRDSLERLEVIGCGNVTMDGLMACHTLRKLKVLYACHLPNVSDDQRVLILAQLKERLGKSDESTEGDLAMLQIIDDLKRVVPLNAVLPSERCIYPEYGLHSECNPNTTIHVDSFLYDDDDIDELCDQGALSSTYCRACGSHTTAPLTFISHSLGLSELKYIFRYLLPSLAGKTLVDVGSRLGGVLYAAYFFSAARKIIGVEMNHDLCKTQASVIEKYGMHDKVQVVCEDVRNQKELLIGADVIVLNNVFQFFLPPPDQTQCWQVIRASTKPGTVLVTVPSLEELTGHLQLDFALDDWVVTVPTEAAVKNFTVASGANSEDLEKVHLYQVK